MGANIGVDKFTIFAQTQLDSGSTKPGSYSFVNKTNNTLQAYPPNDFWIPISMTRTTTLDYVDVSKDSTIYTMERQSVNPFFIEFSIFDSVSIISPTKGSQLTSGQTAYIATVQPAVIGFSDAQIREIYDSTGYDSLPWTVGNLTITADSIAASDFSAKQLSSIAQFFDITLNT